MSPHRFATSGLVARWRSDFPRSRLVTIAVTVLGATVLAAGSSHLLALATSCNGACPTASAPLPFVLLMGAVAAWAAVAGTKR